MTSTQLGYAIVSEHIYSQNLPIGVVCCEEAVFEGDSGWRCFSGLESDAYCQDTTHFSALPLADVLDRHPQLASLIHHTPKTHGQWTWDSTLEHFVVADDTQ